VYLQIIQRMFNASLSAVVWNMSSFTTE